MKKLFFALVIIGVVLLSACTAYDEETPVVNLKERCHKASRVTPEEAAARAAYLLKNLKDPETRGDDVSVASIDVIGVTPSVRSGGIADTLLYYSKL